MNEVLCEIQNSNCLYRLFMHQSYFSTDVGSSKIYQRLEQKARCYINLPAEISGNNF